MKDKYYLPPNTASELQLTARHNLEHLQFDGDEKIFGGFVWKGKHAALPVKCWALPGKAFAEVTLGTCDIDSEGKMSNYIPVTGIATVDLPEKKNYSVRDVDFIKTILEYCMKLVKEKEEAEFQVF